MFIGAVLVTGVVLSSALAQSQSPSKPSQTLPDPDLLSHNCFVCHNQQLKTAGVALDGLRLDAIGPDAAIWERVLRKVSTGEMPPPGMPRPEPPEITAFTSWLTDELDRAAKANPNPGRPGLQRLNRAEYKNAVRDLLALDIDAAEDLPADDSGYGFDNIGDVLSVSPLLMEKYMSAARKVSRLSIGDQQVKPAAEIYRVERRLSQDDRISDDLPFGSRGGAVVGHYFPLDGEYTIQVRLRGRVDNDRPLPKLDFRLDGRRVELLDLKASGEEEQEELLFYEIRTPVKAGAREIGVTFLNESYKFELFTPRRGSDDEPSDPGIDYIQIGGPFNPTGPGETASRQRIFVCRPDNDAAEQPCARRIISSLARLAYRRPVNQDDIKPLLELYAMGKHDGGSFEAGVEMALRAMLVSPSFLFRIERTPDGVPAGGIHRISDVELASRLSFFLWSSIPDGELLRTAEQGRLRDPEVLQVQVRRMLADPKAAALVTNFAGQWLHLRNLSALNPDPDKFPGFNENLRQAFRRETELFFEAIVREDRSVLDLLDADFTYLNERLAEHYGVPGVRGSHFRRVSLEGGRRGGVLTQASILSVTSYPTRTSAVIRGKWILENLLGAPPPPPPPVPTLEETDAGPGATLRQQLEKHRSAKACASCHALMDPIGFALENYDAIGRWRTQDNGADIDASGKLPNGMGFSGSSELKKIMLQRRDEFVACMSEKLLTYALGRGLEYYDKPVVRDVTRTTAGEQYRFSALVMAIVNSTPFQMRRSPAS